MIQDITHRQEHDNLMRDILIYDSKNMDLAEWLLQIEKVASLTQSQEYELATAKSTNMPYKMLKRLGNHLDWLEIKRKLEEVYSPVATKYMPPVTYIINSDLMNKSLFKISLT